MSPELPDKFHEIFDSVTERHYRNTMTMRSGPYAVDPAVNGEAARFSNTVRAGS